MYILCAENIEKYRKRWKTTKERKGEMDSKNGLNKETMNRKHVNNTFQIERKKERKRESDGKSWAKGGYKNCPVYLQYLGGWKDM
jgi:hypothetical protein